MVSVRRDFQDRKEEIDAFYVLLEDIIDKDARLSFNNGVVKSIDVDTTATLKSAAILLIYNIVESTISNSVKHLHEIFSDEDLKFEELNDPIQKLILAHYYSVMKKEENITEDNRLIEIVKFIRFFSVESPVKLYYNEFIKYKSGSQFSGNLDAKSVRSIIGRYGLEITEECAEMQTIKSSRNKLAHGELSFKDVSKNYPYQYMEVMKNRTINFLEGVLDSIQDFINHNEYKK